MLVEIKCSNSYLTYLSSLIQKRRNKNCKYYPYTWLSFYLHISIRIFCTLFICFVLDDLLESICFRIFCSKHSITFENTYSLSCWFLCVDILYIKFTFCETFTVINSATFIDWNTVNVELSVDLPNTYTCMF